MAVGGVVWLDWNEEFSPIKGVNQIVGHTRGKQPRRKISPNEANCDSVNWNLDCDLNYIGTIQDGELTVHDVSKL